MNRNERLQKLINKLQEHQIHEFRKELEDFLQEENDEYTKQLQKAISHKLDDKDFPYQNFKSFLEDYQKNYPTDPAGCSELRSRIYGD